MSQKKNDGKRDARDRLRAERLRERAAERRRRNLIVGGAVVGLLALFVILGIVIGTSESNESEAEDRAATEGKELVYPAGVAGPEGVIIPVGGADAVNVIAVYEDYRCPYCKEVEVALGPTMQQMADEGLVRIEYHTASFLDRRLGGNGSRRAANAAACAQNAGKFEPYHKVLFENAPEESSDAYGSNRRLIELAGQVEGLRTPEFEACVNDGVFAPWVAKSQDNFNNTTIEGRRIQGTPTVTVNGKQIAVLDQSGKPLSPETFRANVDAAIAATTPAGPQVTFTPPPPPVPAPATS